jgi:hypothetical protein
MRTPNLAANEQLQKAVNDVHAVGGVLHQLTSSRASVSGRHIFSVDTNSASALAYP